MDGKATSESIQVSQRFPDELSARKYLEARAWKEGPRCPKCGGVERVSVRKNGFYRCKRCAFDFTVRTGTIFGRSHVPLHRWLQAMYLVATVRNITPVHLAGQLNITLKSATFVLERLREAVAANAVEVKQSTTGRTARSMKESGHRRVQVSK